MLLQRGRFTVKNISELDLLPTESDGLKRIIDLDYMGKIEYEGNTIPLSRMLIEYNIDKYKFYYIDLFNNSWEQMIVYANSEQVDEIDWHEFGLSLIERDYSVYKHIHNSGSENENNFWWSVDNDYFVFFGEEKKELINAFITGCYKRDGGKELIKQKIAKCGYRVE